MTELFRRTAHIHPLKWDFHLSHAVPIYHFAFSTHAPRRHPCCQARHFFGFIQSEHTALYSRASVLSPPLQGFFFFCPITWRYAFFLFFFSFFLGFRMKGLHISFALCSQSFLRTSWLRTRQIGGVNLMTGRGLVGIVFVVSLFSFYLLVPASTPWLSGGPVNNDKWQTHDHEDESQCGKARGLQGRKEREQHLGEKHVQKIHRSENDWRQNDSVIDYWGIWVVPESWVWT